MRMEHYAPWLRPGSTCCCPLRGTAALRSATARRAPRARGRPRAHRRPRAARHLRRAPARGGPAAPSAGARAIGADAARARGRRAAGRGRRARRAISSTELPAGPLRERLAGVLEERALLPAVRVRSAMQPLAVLNGDAKTVVRLVIERPEAILGGRRRVALAPRAVGAAGARLRRPTTSGRCACCATGSGLEAAERPLFDEAVLAAGGRPEGVSTKPSVELAPGTRADAAAALVLTPAARDRRGQRARARSTTSTPSSCTTCACRSAAPGRCCASSRASTSRRRARTCATSSSGRRRSPGPCATSTCSCSSGTSWWRRSRASARAELEPLRALLARRRARELTRLRRGLRGARFRAALDAWRALAEAAPATAEDRPDASRPIEAVAGERIRKVYRRMVARRQADRPTTARPRRCTTCASAARSCATCSSCSAARSRARSSSRWSSTLKDLQEVLGRFQDRAVQTEMLREVREELADRARRSRRADRARPGARGAARRSARPRASSSPSASRASPARSSAALVRDTFPKRGR